MFASLLGTETNLWHVLFFISSTIQMTAGGMKIEWSDVSAGLALVWGRLSRSNCAFLKAVVGVMGMNNGT